MKKVVFSLIVFLVLIPVNAQNKSIEGFYMYLNQVLEDKNIKSIELLMTNYGCLGSEIYSEAKLIKKKNKIEIHYYSKDSEHLDLFEKKLDTTFTVSTNKLIQNFNNEINVFNKRAVFIEGSYKIDIITENSKKDFLLKKVDGLNYLLRYNMTFEEHYKQMNFNNVIFEL